MSNDSTIDKLAPKLWEYLGSNPSEPQKGHLKVMATISDENGNIQWAIFFGNKGSKINGDSDFRGFVRYSDAGRMEWINDRPLWLVPINRSARDEVLKQLENGNQTYIPNISGLSIAIRNSGRGNGNWEYDFWYTETNPNLWNADPTLTLTSDSYLTHLSDQGEWLNLLFSEDKEWWPVWLTTKRFTTGDQLIKFPAPTCYIIDTDGKYSSDYVSLGVQINSLSSQGDQPYIEFVGNGPNYPIKWEKAGRIDNILEPDVSQNEISISIENWKNISKLFKTHIGRSRGVPETIINDFKKPFSVKLRKWIIYEELLNSDGKKVKYFNIFYCRHRAVIPEDGRIFKIIGIEGPDDDDTSDDKVQNIRFVQICRHDAAKLFSRIRYLGKHELQELWNIKTSLLPSALRKIDAGSAVALFPKLDGFLSTKFYHFVSEWNAPNTINCLNSFASFDLINSRLFAINSSQQKPITIRLSNLRTNTYDPLFKYDPNNPFQEEDSNDSKKNDILIEADFNKDINNPHVNDNGTLYQFTLKSFTVKQPQKQSFNLIDGALNFTVANKTPSNSNGLANEYGRFRLVLQLAKSQRPFFLWQWYNGIDKVDQIVLSYAVEDFSLPVRKVEAAGQDPLAKDKLLAPGSLGTAVEGFGERSDPPLVIPLNPDSTEDSQYLLTMSESVNVGQNYRIDMRLQEFNPEANKDKSTQIKAVILDANPQMTSLVNARFLQQPGYDDGAWVLARRSPFSEEAGGWEILDDTAGTEGFHLILPSQGIGEAYVKSGKKQGDEDRQIDSINGEPEKDKPIDYRFGAPAILRLAPERLERRYVAPPWNLRRIWGQPGDVAPGIPFLESQFELLYGLIGNLKPEKAFIAELASKLGEVPVPPVNSMAWQPTKSQEAVFEESWKKYLQFYRAWKSRLAILEPSVDDDFGNATFDKNISFKPRIGFIANNNEVRLFFEEMAKEIQDLSEEQKKRLHELIEKFKVDVKNEADYGIILADKAQIIAFLNEIGNTKYPGLVEELSHLERKGANLRYPIPGSLDVNREENGSNLLEEKIRRAHDKNGLAGGFHYGFESNAIYKEFWREAFSKGSSSGEIKALAHSSVGGWGKQTAKFAADKTVIKSNTSMGRTHFYAVERIGRISVFWHKAKHVIEYERTVVPSEQFKGEQPPHIGRPLVRKVREYIEILEPTRSYPDFATDVQDAPGSVTACTFKSIIIPVLSAWGHDVWGTILDENSNSKKKTIGWEVPLWKPGADPKIYPKPQVVLSLLAPPDADEKQILQNLSEPQNLWFYTDTREFAEVNGAKIPITAVVHAWPAVQEVDFTNLPEPEQYDIEPSAGDSPELIGQPMPDVLDIMPGFERFTFRVDRNEIPSSVAGRYYSNAAITGRMRTVSMMRSVYNLEKENWWTSGTADGKKVKDALYKLIKSKDSLLAISANGFTDLNNKVKTGVETKIEEYTTKIKSFISQSGCLPKLNVISKGVEKPDLIYLKSVKLPNSASTVDLWDEGKNLGYPVKWLWREVLNASEGFINNAIGFYDSQTRTFILEVERLLTNSQQERDEAISILGKFKDRVTAFRNNLEFGIDLLSDIKKETIIHFDNIFDQLHNAIDSAGSNISTFLTNLSSVADLNEARIKIKEKVEQKINQLRHSVKDIPDPWGSVIKNQIEDFSNYLDKWVNSLNEKIDAEYETVAELLSNTRIFIQENIDEFKQGLLEITNSIKKDLAGFLQTISEGIQQINSALILMWDQIWMNFIAKTDEIFGTWQVGEIITIRAVIEKLQSIREVIVEKLIDVLVPVLYSGIPDTQISIIKILKDIDSIIKSIKEWIISSLVEFFGDSEINYKKWFKNIGSLQDLKKALKNGDADSIIVAANTFANHINQEFGQLVGEVTQKYRDAERLVDSGDALIQTGKQTLNNFRSVWEEFTAPGMGLNRRTVAMIVKTDWKDVEQRLSITPCISRVKQFGEGLEGLGLRLPVAAITDRLLPSKAEWGEMKKSLLGKFDFSNLFSDLGGMRFDKLFPGFKMPEFARDKLKITQSADKKNASAWIKAEADVKFTDRKKLLSIGPVQVELENGQFTGEIKFEGEQGKLTRTNSGRLSGSWHIGISGTGLMIFRDTSISFNNGKLTFDLDPRRMEMPGLLKMLTDATTKLSDTGMSGADENGDKKQVFKIGITKVKEIPAGIKAALDIPPISVGGGTTAITNLCFGGHFELKALDDQLRPKFLLGFGFYLGKREAPFNVTIFILGGGGYIFCNLTFEPKRGLTVEFVMSINVSATLAVAAGWITGYVSIMAGFEGEYHKTPQTGGSVYITIYVRVIGMVELMSIVSVFLYLGLEATYRTLGNGGSELVGTGFVQLDIRICRFFKIKVAKSYSKRFAGSGNSGGSKQTIMRLQEEVSQEDIITLKAINILKSLA